MGGPRRKGFNPCRVFSGLATEGEDPPGAPIRGFQSLSGFFRPCNPRPSFFPPPRHLVSIPVGFFQALQHQSRFRPMLPRCCFNPCRVFSGLATSNIFGPVVVCVPFQSLSGFFRPCNFKRRGIIPPTAEFQSLSGFFRPCNDLVKSLTIPPEGGFNPCRVFSGLATMIGRLARLSSTWSFNPCRVFSGLATSCT